MIPEQEYVPRRALYRKVLVDRAYKSSRRLEYHVVIEAVGYGPARDYGRDARALPRTETPVHHIVVYVRGAPAFLRGKPMSEHLHDVVELPPGQISVRISPHK